MVWPWSSARHYEDHRAGPLRLDLDSLPDDPRVRGWPGWARERQDMPTLREDMAPGSSQDRRVLRRRFFIDATLTLLKSSGTARLLSRLHLGTSPGLWVAEHQ